MTFDKGSLAFFIDRVNGVLIAESTNLFEGVKADPRNCGESLFEASDYRSIISREKLATRLSDAVEKYRDATDGEIDWLCFAQDFVALGDTLPERFWVNLRGGQRLVFKVKNTSIWTLGTFVPGGLQGEFQARVVVADPNKAVVAADEFARTIDLGS